MWHNPFGNYPLSYNATDGLPDAFTYFGQTFTRRPDPIVVSRPPPNLPDDQAPPNPSTPGPMPPDSNNNPPSHAADPGVWPMSRNPFIPGNPNIAHLHHQAPFPSQPPLPIPNPHLHQSNRDMALKSTLKPTQYYSQPHPSMWPTVPRGHDMYALNTREPLAADALKYKCTICGRFRSARYHYKHPLLPGQLPGKTICRQCRENATDSDEASTDSYDGKESRRSRSRTRHRRRARARGDRPASRTHSHRSHSRKDIDDSTLSDWSSDSRESRRGRRTPQHPPAGTQRAEVVRYVHCPPEHPIPRRTRTVYIDDPDCRAVVDNYYEDGDVEQLRAERGALHPHNPGPRRVRIQRPEPALSTRKYHAYCSDNYDGPATGDLRHLPYDQRMGRGGERRRATVADEDDDLIHARFDRERHLCSPGTGRYKSREGLHPGHRYDHRPGVVSRMESDQVWIPPAPSPPKAEAAPKTRYSQQAGRQSRRGETASPVCGDNEVIVVETHDSGPREDYDWYDDAGMKVRVREI